MNEWMVVSARSRLSRRTSATATFGLVILVTYLGDVKAPTSGSKKRAFLPETQPPPQSELETYQPDIH